MKPASIRSKMILTSLLPILLMSLVASYSTYTAISLASVYNRLFEKNVLLSSLSLNLDTAQSNLSTYLSTKNSDNLREYIHCAKEIQDLSAGLDSKLIPDQGILMERDASFLAKGFLSFADEAISLKRASKVVEYRERYDRASNSAAALRYTISLLKDWHMERRLNLLSVFTERIMSIQRLDLALMVMLALLDSGIVLILSFSLSTPIIHLSSAAKLIAAGDFNGPDIPVESRDEIGAMTDVFNSMKSGIANYVRELKSKAEIESNLMEQKLKNLEMANLLKHAELSSLQARINPHFLFNTLNAGIQLSTLESADKTRVFLENLSSLMRYSTRSLDTPAPLWEEFDYVEAYAHLVTIRFPGTIDFKFDLDAEVENLPIPKLSIQPLVENAIKHGFGDGLPNARISLRARKDEGFAVVEVEDNGVGFLPGTAEEVDAASESGLMQLEREGRADSIGLVNVIRRLRLYTGRDDAVEIDRNRAVGALIRIRLPLEEERGHG